MPWYHHGIYGVPYLEELSFRAHDSFIYSVTWFQLISLSSHLVADDQTLLQLDLDNPSYRQIFRNSKINQKFTKSAVE